MSDSADEKPTKPEDDGNDESVATPLSATPESAAAAEFVEETERVDEQPTDTAEKSAQGTAADRLKETMHQTADTVQARASEVKQRAQAATAHAAAKAEDLGADAIAKLPRPPERKPSALPVPRDGDLCPWPPPRLLRRQDCSCSAAFCAQSANSAPCREAHV